MYQKESWLERTLLYKTKFLYMILTKSKPMCLGKYLRTLWKQYGGLNLNDLSL